MTRKKYRIKENLWLLKPIAAVLALILTVRYSLPISAKISENTMLDFLSDSSSEYGEQPDVMNAEAKDPLASQAEIELQEPSSTVISTPGGTENETNTPLIYETPSDISEFEKDYLATFANTQAYGSVEEVFFKTSGSTDTVQGIHIKNATATKEPDFDALLNEGPVLDIKNKSDPTVLIFHTHTTESYLLSDNGVFYEDYETRSMDSTKNMVRVGDEICRVLESNGIGYIHDTNIYDESYEGAYSRSRVTVEKYLEEYPTIQIVLDVHRDAIYYSDTSHCKPTAEIDGRKAAQIMIITGAEEGYISDFPDWEDNLRFALCFQKTAEDSFPGLMKPLYFCQRKYNMDTAKCSLLLEMGTDANTLDEAVYSGFLTGKVLTEIINRYCGE